MKILQVCSATHMGGGERHVADLTRALIERGHELHLAVRRRSPLREALKNLPVTWHELGLQNALDLVSVYELRTIIRAAQIEVLHAHVARDYVVCGLAAKRSPVRLFITRHHFNPIKSNALYTRAIGDVRRMIAVSNSVSGELIQAFPKFSDRVAVIPNWIDLRDCGSVSREVARRALGLRRPLAIAVIGQITPLKQQDLFISAAAKLIKEQAVTNAEFFIAGEVQPQDGEFSGELRLMIRHAEIGDYVRFTGYVENLPSLLAAFDIVVAPSENEAFSLALAEAMAAGCAVIAARAGGMAEMVEDGVSGLLFTPGDEQSLIAGMQRLISSEELRRSLGAVARQSARERFEREQVIDRIEQLYQQC
jgi:glycosyltransferase involved in cell wall biosynthesis